MLTRAEYKTLVQHFTGGSVNASMGSTAALTEVQLIDQSFQFLFDVHPWQWRLARHTDIPYTNGQEYITLPKDVGELLDVDVTDGTNDYVQMSSLAELQMLRSSTTIQSNRYWVALSYPGQQGKTQGADLPRLEIWPTPSADDPTGLRLSYRRRYVPMTADTDVPNIPDWLELAAKDCLRAVCLAHEDEDEGAYERFVNGVVLRKAIERDNRQQWNFGPPSNTAMSAVAKHGRLPFNSIADPS